MLALIIQDLRDGSTATVTGKVWKLSVMNHVRLPTGVYYQESPMARKTITISDLSNKEIDGNDAVEITVKFADLRRGVYRVDAHVDDRQVQELVKAGVKVARRGRRPKSAAE